MKSSLVCFIGIDGSGKTTLCKLLVNELRSRRIPSRYVYGRFLPTMIAPLFKIVPALMFDRGNSQRHYHTRLKKKRRLLSNPIISNLFIVGVLFDQILQILLKICLPSVFKKEVVVCDRYFFDTALIDIAIPCGISDDSIVQLVRRYLPLFPKTHMVFLVRVPPGIAYQRKKDILSRTALERLSKTYLYVAKHFGATIIDGTKNLSELKSVLLSKMESSGISSNGWSRKDVK